MGLISGERTRTRTSTWEENKTQELPYVDTLKTTVGEKDLAGLESPGGTQSSGSSPTLGQQVAHQIQQSLTAGLAGHDVERQTTNESSGWAIKNQYYKTRWDKARYAIGIKEIGAWAYKYAQKSGFISVPFRTPKPIRSVSLHTDEIIPKAFSRSGPVRPWIRYWITFDDGQNWTEIAPAAEGAFNRIDNVKIPQTIHVNAGIPEPERDPRAGYVDFDVDVTQVRLKAIMERPENLTDTTPVLKGYRLRIIVRGGL